ncbi:MAG: flagellar M-ring protein FliF [Treponema sp.]|jgi:flagellar M-ring protein FliF|nr:flagellar M-ring protein FliF [Treponema sp.]
MNDFFKKLLARITALWAGWPMQQRIMIGVIAVVVIGMVIALFMVSSTPVLISVIDAPIRDQSALDRIILRLNQENIKVTVSPTGLVQVADEATARRMRTILIREDLIPSGIDPWAVFDTERWTITDFERNVNFRRAQERLIVEHIRAIEDIDDVGIQIVWPTRELFASQQNPVSVSVRITPKPGSDITLFPQNRGKIEGIQKLLQFAIEGLHPEHIVITDHTGIVLNDFDGMAAADRLALIEQEQKQIRRTEAHYREAILVSLQRIFSSDRVRDLNIKIDMDMSVKSIESKESYPIIMKPQTAGLSYDDSILLESIVRSDSVSETTWRGTGFMPEGPTGVENNVTPAFRDMSNLYGEVSQNTRTTNNEINQRSISEERSPSIDRVTVSVNIDGTWKWKYDAKGNPVETPDKGIEREYTPVSAEYLRYAEDLIRDAIGYNPARGDSVTVRNIPVDRAQEFKDEDAAYFRQKQMQMTIIVFIIGLTIILAGFMLFRMISREMERRRRLAEEERARREQMLRESAMAEAESDGTEVSISLEERTRMELMENAINMAKEHPEDAAQLIRTWLLEE